MTNRFLNTVSALNLTDGSVDIYASSLTASNFIPSLPVRTNANKILTTGLLQISDIQGLQNALNTPSGASGNILKLATPTSIALYGPSSGTATFLLTSSNITTLPIPIASFVVGSIFTIICSGNVDVNGGGQSVKYDMSIGSVSSLTTSYYSSFSGTQPTTGLNTIITIQCLNLSTVGTINTYTCGCNFTNVMNTSNYLYSNSFTFTNLSTTNINWALSLNHSGGATNVSFTRYLLTATII